MLTYILILLCLPPLCAVLALAAGFGNNILHWLHRLTATAVGVCVALMAKSFNPAVPYVDDYFYIDALNMWVIIIITTLYLAATWTARNYLTREERCSRASSCRPAVTLRLCSFSAGRCLSCCW